MAQNRFPAARHGVAAVPPGVVRQVDIELFAGAGGLSLGLQQAGMRTEHLFELDPYCCQTLRANGAQNGGQILGRVEEVDVRLVEWSRFEHGVALVSGGAPCQPFSLGGKHLASRDGRNLFPEVHRAIRALKPAIVVLENVQGLTTDLVQLAVFGKINEH